MKVQFFRKWRNRGSGHKGMLWLKKKGAGKYQLSTRIAFIAGIMLVVVFTAMIGITSRMTKKCHEAVRFQGAKDSGI
jgi:methyl-accepting chemotaxis protein